MRKLNYLMFLLVGLIKAPAIAIDYEGQVLVRQQESLTYFDEDHVVFAVYKSSVRENCLQAVVSQLLVLHNNLDAFMKSGAGLGGADIEEQLASQRSNFRFEGGHICGFYRNQFGVKQHVKVLNLAPYGYDQLQRAMLFMAKNSNNLSNIFTPDVVDLS